MVKEESSSFPEFGFLSPDLQSRFIYVWTAPDHLLWLAGCSQGNGSSRASLESWCCLVLLSELPAKLFPKSCLRPEENLRQHRQSLRSTRGCDNVPQAILSTGATFQLCPQHGGLSLSVGHRRSVRSPRSLQQIPNPSPRSHLDPTDLWRGEPCRSVVRDFPGNVPTRASSRAALPAAPARSQPRSSPMEALLPMHTTAPTTDGASWGPGPRRDAGGLSLRPVHHRTAKNCFQFLGVWRGDWVPSDRQLH